MTFQSIVGFGVLAIALVFLADIPATSELAVALAFLILLSILLVVGPIAFDNVSKLLTGTVPVSTNTASSPGGRGGKGKG